MDYYLINSCNSSSRNLNQSSPTTKLVDTLPEITDWSVKDKFTSLNY